MIVSSARSGSTTLVTIMGSHPDIQDVAYGLDLDQVEGRIRSSYSWIPECARVMTTQTNPWAVREWAESERMPVILLERKNIFRAVVSEYLARYTNAWGKDRLPKDYRTLKFDPTGSYSRTGYTTLGEAIKRRRQITERYNKVFKGRCFHLVYEDFYFSGNWRRILCRLYEYVGYRPVITKTAEKLMQTARMNDERIYRNIIGVYQLERKWGSNENGWLLGCSPPML